MAGYSGYSKSNNAVAAEIDGRLPLTHAAKAVAAAAGITQTAARRVLRAMGPSEWHHSSKFYNRVDYYNVSEALEHVCGNKIAAALDAAAPGWRDVIDAARPDAATSTMEERHEAVAPVYAALAAAVGLTPDDVEHGYYYEQRAEG